MKTTHGARTEFLALSFFLLLTIIPFASANIYTNNTLFLPMNETANGGLTMRDFANGQNNWTLTTGAQYASNVTAVWVANSSSYLRSASLNIFNIGTQASPNATIMNWYYLPADTGADIDLLTIAFGSTSRYCYVQWSGDNDIHCDLKNSTGGDIFEDLGVDAPIGKWFALTHVYHANGTIFWYVTEENGTAEIVHATQLPSGLIRNSSGFPGAVGGLTRAPVGGYYGGMLINNQSFTTSEVQARVESGHAFDKDRLSLPLNLSVTSGYIQWLEGSNVHTGFMLSNVSQYNPFPARLDCNNDGSEDCNITEAYAQITRQLFENITVVNGVIRAEFSMQSAYYTNGTVRPCSVSDYASICMQTALNYYAYLNNYTVKWSTDYMPYHLADNTTALCTIGTADCPASNWTKFGQFVEVHARIIGCDNFTKQGTNNSTCEFQAWNENDLTLFWLPQSASRTSAAFRNQTMLLVKAVRDGIRASNSTRIRDAPVWVPPMADAFDSTSVAVLNNLLSDLSAQGVTDLRIPIHLYHDAWNNDGRYNASVINALNSILTKCNTYGFICDRIAMDEWGTFDAANQNASIGSYGYKQNQIDIVDALHAFAAWTNNTLNTNFYQLALWGNYSGVSAEYPRFMSAIVHPQLNPTTPYASPYDPLHRFTTYHTYGSSRVACPLADAYVSCTVTKNGTLWAITLTNTGDLARNITLPLSGVEASNLRNTRSGSTFAISSNTVTLTDLPAKTSNTYTFTLTNISFNTTTPAINVSIAEPNNQTFSYTLNNGNGETVTSTWRVNGTNVTSCYNLTACTFLGNYTSAGIYSYNVTVVSEQTSISYQWQLTVNNTDAQGPTVTVVSPTATTYTTSTILISFNATDADNNVSSLWFYNGTANVTYTAPVNITLPDATYNLAFYANDTLGNIGTTTVAFTVDTVPETCTDLGNGYGVLFRIVLIFCVVVIAFSLYQIFGDGDAGVSSILLVSQIIAALVIAITVIGPLVTNYCLT